MREHSRPLPPNETNQLVTRPTIRRLGTLYVCLVTKGTNAQTVVNSVRCWDTLPQRDHPSVRFHVVLDSSDPGDLPRQLPSYVTIDQVPEVVPVKKARFKARALEHFRQKYNFSKEDWILHLDEESEIDDRVMRTSLDFIEKGTADFGMGTIYYTSTNHWKNAFLSAAEVSRLAEDFGRFQLPVRTFRRPFLGWILINGAVENKITWDTDNVCEDYWFGYHAAKQGFKFEWLHAIVREQPPCTFTNLWNQRRRWYTGILAFDRIVVRLALIVGGILGGG
ncbi:glycosyltransferase family 2 protein, partial [Aspergillus ibericus CBS 121593]